MLPLRATNWRLGEPGGPNVICGKLSGARLTSTCAGRGGAAAGAGVEPALLRYLHGGA
jgi:hypothetical protein